MNPSPIGWVVEQDASGRFRPTTAHPPSSPEGFGSTFSLHGRTRRGDGEDGKVRWWVGELVATKRNSVAGWNRIRECGRGRNG
jgi:hypothetical protein